MQIAIDASRLKIDNLHPISGYEMRSAFYVFVFGTMAASSAIYGGYLCLSQFL